MMTLEINDWLVIAMFASFIALLFMGFPVAWVLAGVGVIFCGVGYLADQYLGTLTGLDLTTLGLVVNRIYKIMDNWVLVALPMFIFMGLMLDESGIAQKLMQSMQAMFGKVRGGLAVTVTSIGIILAASTGIIGASVVLLGLLGLKPMLDQGYDKPLALGTIAGAGTLGILIPPSIMLVIMADQVGTSVGDLFMAALLPGLILGALYIVFWICMGFIHPNSAPLPENVEPLSFSVVAGLLKSIIPPVLLILAVLGSIFAGMTTPTEASGVGALGASLLALFNRRLNFAVMRQVCLSTFNTTAYIFAIFLGATCFSLVLRELGGDELIERSLLALPFGPMGVVLAILFVVFLLGFLLDWIEITLIVLPLMAPIVSNLGLGIHGFAGVDDPVLVWFLILVAVTLQTSFLTPPVGFALFYLKGVCPPQVQLIDIYRGVIPFIIIQVVALVLVIVFPALALWLPSIAYN
jgi:tripartite ATP-independent transporter DctM subunit